MIKEIHGDLIQLALAGQCDVIVHGCNCYCTMGAGLAKFIKASFPAAYQADLATVKGDRRKLGTCTFAQAANLVVVNAYTQFDFRGPKVRVDYDAVRSCMEWVARTYKGSKIGLPKIGAGLAGGDWPTIRAILEETLGQCDASIMIYQP